MTKQLGPTLMIGGGERILFWRIRPLWIRVRLLWEPRDCWIGMYHRRVITAPIYRARDFYVCIIPCLPLMVSIWLNRRSTP